MFLCHLLLFSEAIMLDQSEMLFCVGDILTALTSVSGRKHPSTVQAKQLKMCLPMMPVVLHLVTSQVDSRVLPPPLIVKQRTNSCGFPKSNFC